ncbi:MAG: hypothetical protein BGO99_11895 [Nitrosospira sp. 56-18]|jgi:hypothetical protein|nr:MAG: hypothetical protein BGO99_11895 [Nitrosospira sp. 56-18]
MAMPHEGCNKNVSLAEKSPSYVAGGAAWHVFTGFPRFNGKHLTIIAGFDSGGLFDYMAA